MLLPSYVHIKSSILLAQNDIFISNWIKDSHNNDKIISDTLKYSLMNWYIKTKQTIWEI